MNAIKVHNFLGKLMCATGGAIVGFILGGPLFAVIGTIPGFTIGVLMQRFLSL